MLLFKLMQLKAYETTQSYNPFEHMASSAKHLRAYAREQHSEAVLQSRATISELPSDKMFCKTWYKKHAILKKKKKTTCDYQAIWVRDAPEAT